VAAAILVPVISLASLLGVFAPFTAQPDMTRIGRESALSLDQRLEITTGSLPLLQREATEDLMQAEPASVVQPSPRLDEDAPRIEAPAHELAEAHRKLDEAVQRTQTAEIAAEELRKSLQQEQARNAELAKELAGARRELDASNAQSHKADDVATQQRDAAAREIAELQQSLQQERQRNGLLVKQANAAQAAAASAEQERHEAQSRAAALASELAGIPHGSLMAEAAAAEQKDSVGREVAELRQSLQQELSGTEARQKDRASASAPTGARLQVEQTNEGPIVPAARSVEAAVAEPLTAADQNEAEARLIPRARALLDQGNIGAARIVLELAAEKDIAQANFMLAETYDPAVLSAWGTYGTRGEAAKARELYAKAHRGGIREAKERLDALQR
jgi:chromosome segregation ATPase